MAPQLHKIGIDFRPAAPSFSSSGDSLGPTIFSSASRSFDKWIIWLLFFSVFFLRPAPASAQASKEYQLKAVFLWRLAQFTQWPGDAFEQPDSPIVLCVLGENPFGEALEAAVRGETAQGRKLVVQHHRGIEGIKACHVLYISRPVARQPKEVIPALAGRSVLTVTESDALARAYPAMVRFATEQNRIKLLINVKAATAARLVFDSRLLRAAEITENE